MKTAKQYLKEDLRQAEYVGEDGGMIVNGDFTRHGAWRKMIQRLREDCGDIEADEFIEEVKPTNLSRAYFKMLPEGERDQYEGSEWYVSLKEKSPYEVWVWWG